jgi:hypothetical protein
VSVDSEESEIYAIRENPDRRVVWAIGGTSGGQVSAIWVESKIGILEFLRTRSLRHFESQTLKEIRTVHLVDVWQRSAPSGKVPTRSKFIGVWSSSGYRGSRDK